MNPLSFAQFASVIRADLLESSKTDLSVSGVTTNSRQIPDSSAFFALQGTTDGHRYVANALANGASVAVVSRAWLSGQPPIAVGPHQTVLAVDDPLLALQALAAWWRTQWSAKVIAIAGSNGKTTTKDAVHRLLSRSFRCSASPGSFNSQLGVPLAILQTPPDVDFAIFEAGFSEPGEMDRHATMLRPDFGVLTNVGWTNVSRFGSRLNIAAEMARLFAGVSSSGWLVAPDLDQTLVAAIESLSCPVLSRENLPKIVGKSSIPQGVLLKVAFPDGGTVEFPVGAAAIDALASIEAAIGVAHRLGLSPHEIASTLAGYSPSLTRREVWKSPNGITVINETDTSDPISVQAALRSLRTLSNPGGRKLFLFGGDASTPDADLASIGELSEQYDVDELLWVGGTSGDVVRGRFSRLFHPFRNIDSAKSFLATNLRSGDSLLVKGPAGTGVAEVARNVVEAMAPTRFYLDLKAVTENVNRFRRAVGPDTKILAMIKALAYGSDSVQLAHELETMDVDWIGVSSADEGVQLRRAGIRRPILVMMCAPEEAEKLPRFGLTPMVYSFEIAEAIARAARAEGTVLDVHMEVDTGMGRTGVSPARAEELALAIRDSGCLRLTGLMTHFPAADDPAEDEFTRRQTSVLVSVAKRLHNLGFENLTRHAAATAGAMRFPEARLDMVRIGLGLYGLYPSPAAAQAMELVPAVSLVSRIVEIQTHERGAHIGYGRTYEVDRDGFRAAVVPAGYHDGIPWRRAVGGYVLLEGVRAPVCGRISMDSMVVDVSEIPSAQVGSEVVIYGRRGANELRPEDAAAGAGTIVYELLAGLGPRVQRIFIGR